MVDYVCGPAWSGIVGNLDRLVPSKMVPTSMMDSHSGCHCNWSVWPSAHNFSYLLICAYSSSPWTVIVSCAHHSLQTSTAQVLIRNHHGDLSIYLQSPLIFRWNFTFFPLFKVLCQTARNDDSHICKRTSRDRLEHTKLYLYPFVSVNWSGLHLCQPLQHETIQKCIRHPTHTAHNKLHACMRTPRSRTK